MEQIPAKTILSGYAPGSKWFGINYNMNIYKGCCHGCIYCDSRSACYRVEDFDRVRCKENALETIRNDLRRKVKHGVVGTGAMSDPYNPFEKELLLTRHALELVDAYGFGASVTTKSALVTRDIDLLADIQGHSPVLCMVTVTTPDDELCRVIEPRVSVSSERLGAVEALAGAGVFTGVLLMPVLPFLTDTEESVLEVVRLARRSGARFVYGAMGMTLRMNQRDHYYRALDRSFPGLRERYQKTYGERYDCSSPKAAKLWRAFAAECDRLGVFYQMGDIIRASRAGYEDRQLTFY